MRNMCKFAHVSFLFVIFKIKTMSIKSTEYISRQNAIEKLAYVMTQNKISKLYMIKFLN